MAQNRLRLTNGEIHGGLLRNRIRSDSKSFSGSSIYYCHFHVGQLWEKRLKQNTTVRIQSALLPLATKEQ